MENKEISEIVSEDVPVEADVSNKKKNKKRTTIVATAILVVSIILCVWVISQVLSRGYISVAGYSLFRVATGSMEPEMPVGTLLVSKEVDIGDIKVNDIVNFRSKEAGMVGMVITHRVIGVYEDTEGKILLETRGDANPYADVKPVEEDNLIGLVVAATGEGNFFADLVTFLTSKIGFWSFIVLPCILVGVLIMKDTIKTMRNEMDAIHKELDEISSTVKEKDSQRESKEESYEEMYERLRKELLEELGQSAEQIETDDASGNGDTSNNG